MRAVLALLALVLAGESALAAPPEPRFFFGGGVGVGFGSVDFVEIAPLVGVRATSRLSAGLGLLYRFRNDDRFSPDLTTQDWGGNLFAQYAIVDPVFLQAEYEYLDYEYRAVSGVVVSDSASNVLAGAGVSHPIGGHAAFYFAALYNFSYDEDDPASPYDSPWVYRSGVIFGF